MSKLKEIQNSNDLEDMLKEYKRLNDEIEKLEWNRKILKFKIKSKGGEIES